MSDPTPPFSSLQPVAPAAPATGFCRLYGKLYDLTGVPAAFRAIAFRLLPTTDVGGVSGGVGWVDPVRAVSDRTGYFQVDLPQEARIHVELPTERIGRVLYVPAEETAVLFDYLFPYPVRLLWCFADDTLEDDDYVGIIPMPVPNQMDGETGEDIFLGLAVEWSNGAYSRIPDPNYTTVGADTDELVEEGTIQLMRSTAGTIVVTCTEEEEAGEDVSLWTRAGYSNPYPPYYVPETANTLTNAETLTITVA